MEEALIISMVRAGDTDAFAQIIEHYETRIQRYLYRLTGDYELTQDLAQDTFVQAYKNILKTTADISFKAWLYRIATNNARQYHRRRKIVSFVPLDGNEAEGLDTENESDPSDIQPLIQEALFKVPADQRSCLVLHFVEGFKYKEIADTLGISEEAVRKRVARGKQVFRRLYREVKCNEL